jgi:hypothetical protein
MEGAQLLPVGFEVGSIILLFLFPATSNIIQNSMYAH